MKWMNKHMDEIRTMTGETTNNDSPKLGSRLKAIAEFIPDGSLLGDIGTDHAYLPVFLTQKEKITHAIGVDIHKGPFLSAKRTVSEYKIDDKIEINSVMADPLASGEVNTLSIAGCGGRHYIGILNDRLEVMQVLKMDDTSTPGCRSKSETGFDSSGLETSKTKPLWKKIIECIWLCTSTLIKVTKQKISKPKYLVGYINFHNILM